MTRCWATVASYLSLPLAVADWNSVAHGDRTDAFELVDATLVEGDAETIRTVHRQRLRGGAQGAVATALVGMLRPAAIVTGAVAGGVGGRVLVALSQGLSRADLAKLGAALDAGSFNLVAVSHQDGSPEWVGFLDRSVALESVESTIPCGDLDRAVELDNADHAHGAAVADDPDDDPPPAAPADR